MPRGDLPDYVTAGGNLGDFICDRLGVVGFSSDGSPVFEKASLKATTAPATSD